MRCGTVGAKLIYKWRDDPRCRGRVVFLDDVPVVPDRFDRLAPGVVDVVVFDGGVTGIPVEEHAVGEDALGLAVRQITVAPDVVKPVVEDVVGCVEVVHRGEMDARAVDRGR